jgi:Flp pilus assembly protein TadG
MVEMAVTLPLLILIFIGLIEIGWAILGYMRLSQATREAARFAVRQDVAEFWNKDNEKAYQMVATQFRIAGGKPEGGTLVIHRYQAYTGTPCETQPCNNECQPAYQIDDEALFWSDMQGITRTSKISDTKQLALLMAQNLMLNCQKQLRFWQICLNSGKLEDTCRQLMATNVNTDDFDNDSVLVEAFYDQPQLTGFYWFYDPIPLWAYTIMRLPQ